MPVAGEDTAHLVLTKYNAEIPGRPDRPGLALDWLARRLALFAAWTVPAMRAQTHRPCGWLVFVDADTPPADLAALVGLVDGVGEVVPVAGPLTDARIGGIVAEWAAPGARVLVTTRLDSDDAIAADCLARVAVAARGWRGFVNAPHGYRVRDGRVVRCREPSGPFLSFVEEAGGGPPLTVFRMPHHEAAWRAPVRQLAGPPAWLQVVHGGNLANRFAGWPARGERVRADLGLPHLAEARLDGRLGAAERAVAAARALRQEASWAVRAGIHSLFARSG